MNGVRDTSTGYRRPHVGDKKTAVIKAARVKSIQGSQMDIDRPRIAATTQSRVRC
jgi:hypothetical protein